ncbi:MAG: hypothetical protein ACRDZ4_02445 [Egibacteraceae bacterium]
MATDADVGLKPTFSDLFDVKAARVVLELLGAGWTPADFAAAELEALRRVFAGRGVRLCRPLARRVVARAGAALPAHPAAGVGKAVTVAGLLAAVATHDTQIAGLQAEMGRLWPTPKAPS